MRSLIKRILILIYFFSVLFVLPVNSNAYQTVQKKQILVLCSGDYENLWTTGILNKLRNNFAIAYPAYHLNIENINFNENSSISKNYLILGEYLTGKYDNTKFDLIISIGDVALSFTDYLRGNIFKGVPVLFSGVHKVDSLKHNPSNGFSGLKTNSNLFETIQLYLSLTPERKNIIFVFDSSETGKIKKQLVLAALNRLNKKDYNITVFENIGLPKFISNIKQFERNGIIFLAGRFRDEFNTFNNIDLAAEVISDTCDIPMYSLHCQLVRTGIVSYRIPNVAKDGQLLTTKAVKILQGVPIKDIPIENLSDLRFIFNYERLKHFNIDVGLIPEQSAILNREEPFLKKYFGYILFVLGVIISSIIIFVLVKNISGRKKAEKILRESEERFKEIYENSTVGIYRSTPDGRVLMANPAFIKILGYNSFEELAQLNVEHEAKKAGYDRAKFKIQLEQKTILKDYNSFWRKKDDQLVYVKENARIYKNRDGSVAYYEGMVEDITDRKKAEDARLRYIEELKHSKEVIEKSAEELMELNSKLYSSEEKLKALNQSKDKFFSLISHDLRSPFNSVLGFSEILANNIEDLSMLELKSFSENIHGSLKNLYKLIENLLQWSGLQTGRFDFKPVNLNLNKLCEEVFTLLKGNIIKKNIYFTNSIPKDLIAFADAFMIRSVLQNLLSNAIKFTNMGGKINMLGAFEEENVTIIVKDTGTGISEKGLASLFRIESSYSRLGTEGESGTGLGLILCKELIEVNKGKIKVESEIGKGSSFFITLPSASVETNES